MSEKVQGFCPMGCGETLFLGSGGYVTCSWIDCPNPTAVSDILANQETEHIVLIGAGDFSLQHPLRERLNGELFNCALHEYLESLTGPPRARGRYRVRHRVRILPGDDSYKWVAL